MRNHPSSSVLRIMGRFLFRLAPDRAPPIFFFMATTFANLCIVGRCLTNLRFGCSSLLFLLFIVLKLSSAAEERSFTRGPDYGASSGSLTENDDCGKANNPHPKEWRPSKMNSAGLQVLS
jgi:hypothetical protein